MTITKPQAQMIATLACDARPTGARRWNPDDVMAEIAKLADRTLGSVICAVTRCAMDRGAERPACITSAGSHWGDTMVAAPFVPRVLAAEECCSVCSSSKPSCQIQHGGRCDGCDKGTCGHHEFKSKVDVAREAADAKAHVAALKAELVPTAGPTARRTLEDMAEANPELHERLERVRQMIPDAQMREVEPTSEESA